MHGTRRGRIVAPRDWKAWKWLNLSPTKSRGLPRRACTEDDVLITGDTVVVLHGKVLEKPVDEAHACEMLRALSGQTHTVASAVAVTTLEHGTQSALDVCDVTFNALLPESFIQTYVARVAPWTRQAPMASKM